MAMTLTEAVGVLNAANYLGKQWRQEFGYVVPVERRTLLHEDEVIRIAENLADAIRQHQHNKVTSAGWCDVDCCND